MRSFAIAAAAGPSLASLTACQTFDARIQENLPQICERAEQTHEAFTFITMTGFVPVRLIAREAQAWEVMQELCASPEKATTTEVLVGAVRASAVILRGPAGSEELTMNVGKISKAIAGAAAAGLAASGATVIVIPEGVEAPWWGYVLAGAISAAIGFATVYLAPANKAS